MNTNISSLQTIVNALQENDYITNVSPVRKDGEVIGYTITFAHSDTITIYHGEDGKNGENGADGKDGYTPQIGVMKDTDDIYYWTVDGEWLLDGKGNKIKAVGQDGADGKDGTDGEDGKDGTNGTNGSNGTNGENGKDGVDGVTPRLKIENDYWYISYDEGKSWEQLGKATGEDGADGSDGADGDSIFKSVTQDDEYVYFNLADGTMITLPKHDKDNIQFEDINVKMICCEHWDTNYDGELSYAEAAAVTDLGRIFKANDNIVLFDELKYFTGLTSINEYAFHGCRSLWKITIPKNVKTISSNVDTVGDCGAFNGCSNLYRITLHEGITTIREKSFYDCKMLQQIVLPESVTEIGSSAFYGCSNLKYMYIGNNVEGSFGGFFNCTGSLICNSPIREGTFVQSEFTSVTLGGNCTILSTMAFLESDYDDSPSSSYHARVQTLILEDSIKEIGAYAVNTSSLKYVYCKSTTPPQGAKSMFYSKLTKIYVPIGCAEAYKTAEYWKDYASKIEEYDFENNPIE